MDPQNTVKEALNALYHHPDDSVRTQADQWLQDFQRTIDAWQVADNLLHDVTSNLETLMFCSQTLRCKVQRDIEELPSEAFHALQISLNNLLKKFCKGPPRVRTQISIAVAALAVHVPAEDWGVGGILYWLRDEMNCHPELVPGFLELLTVLPEEVFNYKIAARPERRRQFERELTSGIDVALNILTACLTASELIDQVLEAFGPWLRLKHGIPGSVLASHPLVLTALSSLNSEHISDAAVNVVSELIHYSASGNSGGISVQMPLIQVIVPHLMSLKPLLGDTSKDEEDVKAIARLLADVGDTYVELIATGSDESMSIVNALLEVASHSEYDIAAMTFNFWHNLQVNLTRRNSYFSYESEASIEAERCRRLQVFRSSYESLVSLVYFRVEYPQDYLEYSYEDIKDFKQTRYAVADVLADAASILGGDATLKLLYMKLVEVVTCGVNDENGKWRSVEAALYCIRAISNYVSDTENEIMPQVMILLRELPKQALLLQTVCLTIGAYSKWLDASASWPSILPTVIDILMSGMCASEDSAAAASLAFRHICNDCRKKLCGSLDGLFNIYQRTICGDSDFKVSAQDSLHMVEAISMVIAELPPHNAKSALEALCVPVVSPLQEIINQGPEILTAKPARELVIHIDRCAYIFRHVTHPEAVAEAIQRIWPIYKIICDLRSWDTRTMESVCRACKYAVRNSGRSMGVTLGAILEEIQGLYQVHQQPCFLYLSSEVIKIFGSDPSCATYLLNLIESLFSRTTCLLTSLQDFTVRPDMADDCFLLASRCIRYCPHLFLSSAIFASLLDCSMHGITVQHREASNSILSFLSDVFDLENSSQREQFLHARDTVIIPRGAAIMRILIASLAGALPISRLETVSYAILALVRAYGGKALEWAKGAIALIPPAALTESESCRVLAALSDAASGVEIQNLVVPLEELSDLCRRNRKVMGIVQEALRPLEMNVVGPC